MAAQRDGVGELRRDRQQGQHVAIAQRLLQPVAVELEGFDEACRLGLLGVDTFELGPVRVGQKRCATGVAQHFAHRLLRRLEFVDCRGV